MCAWQTLPPIPFDEIDENSLQWEDGPPPDTSVVSKETGALLVDDNSPSTFAGWVEFSPYLRRIMTYGQMKGIRFVYADNSEKYFGDAEGTSDWVQDIGRMHGEKVIGVYEITEEVPSGESYMFAASDSEGTVSNTSGCDGPGVLPRLWVCSPYNLNYRIS